MSFCCCPALKMLPSRKASTGKPHRKPSTGTLLHSPRSADLNAYIEKPSIEACAQAKAYSTVLKVGFEEQGAPLCPRGHKLQLFTSADAWRCCGCSKDVFAGQSKQTKEPLLPQLQRHRCDECDFNLCKDCFSIRVGINRDDVHRKGLLKVVRHGLTPVEPGKSPRVAVVGAGIAGCTAAYELLRAGFDVTVLERTQRAGGRIYTVREPFSDGLYGEAGAMRIPAGHLLVHAYAHVVGAKMQRFRNSFPHAYCHFDEQLCPTVDGMPPILDKFAREIAGVVEEIEESTYEEVVKKYDPMSFRGFLEHKGWSEDEILQFSVASTEESYMQTGAVENIAEFVGRVWDDYDQHWLCKNIWDSTALDDDKICITGLHDFVGGMDQYTEAFLRAKPGERSAFAGKENIKTVGECVQYGAKVVRFESTGVDEPVDVHFETSQGPKKIQADYVVIAVPFPCLRFITCKPAWSVEKAKAIRGMHFATSGKIFLQYGKRWWEDGVGTPPKGFVPCDPTKVDHGFYVDEDLPGRGTGGGGAFTTLPIRQIYFPPVSHQPGTERCVVIVSYTWEDDTMAWGSMTEKDRVDEAARQVAQIFPESAEHYELGASVMWHQQEWTGGAAFAYLLPGEWSRLYDITVKPEGRFTFCGEHCSMIHSWIQGAQGSAVRAAQEVSCMAAAI